MKVIKIVCFLFVFCVVEETWSEVCCVQSDSFKYKLNLKKSVSNPFYAELNYFKENYGLTGKNRNNGLNYRYNSNRPSFQDRIKDSALEDLNLQSLFRFDSLVIQVYTKDTIFNLEIHKRRNVLVWIKNEVEIKIFDLYKLCNTSREELQDVRIEDSLVYFNLACPSYSKEMGGKCSRMYCLNVNSGELVWRSEVLTSNGIFILYGDLIVSGYGFSKEKDNVFLIDKKTGEVRDSYPINKMMQYVEIKDGELYVVDYNKRLYVFEIQSVKN